MTEPGFESWPLGSREYSLSLLPAYPVQEGLPEASGSFPSPQDMNTARTPSIPFLPSPASSLGHNRAPALCPCFLLEAQCVFQSTKRKELVRGGCLLHLASILSWGPVLQATGRQGPTGPRRVLFLWPEPGSFSLSSKESGERTQQLLLLTHGHLRTLGSRVFVVFNPLPRDDTGRLLISACMVELFISVLTFIASSLSNGKADSPLGF